MTEEKRTYDFDPDLAGRRAQHDGGWAEAGAIAGHRDHFAGRLTGHYFVDGEPPLVWRWFLMTDFTEKPDDYNGDAVWCEETFLFIEGSSGEKQS